MLSVKQIKLVQAAARAAGLRTAAHDGRYRLLLGQYKKPNGTPVKSCKELNHGQLEDFLGVCESLGFRMPGKSSNYFRTKVLQSRTAGRYASFAQQAAIGHLGLDLGWGIEQVAGFLRRMTGGKIEDIELLSPRQAHNVIEALKAMYCRDKKLTLNQIKRDTEVTHGKIKTSQVS